MSRCCDACAQRDPSSVELHLVVFPIRLQSLQVEAESVSFNTCKIYNSGCLHCVIVFGNISERIIVMLTCVERRQRRHSSQPVESVDKSGLSLDVLVPTVIDEGPSSRESSGDKHETSNLLRDKRPVRPSTMSALDWNELNNRKYAAVLLTIPFAARIQCYAKNLVCGML